MAGFACLTFAMPQVVPLAAVSVAAALLVPLAAHAQTTSYFVGFSKEGFSVDPAPDWSVTYIEATPGKNPVQSPSAKLLTYYAAIKARGRLYFRETYDREEASFRIDCARRTWVVTEMVRFAKDKEVSRVPGTGQNTPFVAGSQIDIAAQIACDGNANSWTGNAVANRADDVTSRLAMLQAVKASNDGGRWIAVRQGGATPNRAAFLVDTASVIVAAGSRRLATGQLVLENSADGHSRSLYRLSIDCSARTAETLFAVSYKSGSIPVDTMFGSRSEHASIAQFAADAVCGSPPRPDQILPGSGAAVAANYFNAQK